VLGVLIYRFYYETFEKRGTEAGVRGLAFFFGLAFIIEVGLILMLHFGLFRVLSCAWRAADSADICAAYGVDLREPLKPTTPDDDQLRTAPVGSVMVTMVLLKVDLM